MKFGKLGRTYFLPKGKDILGYLKSIQEDPEALRLFYEQYGNGSTLLMADMHHNPAIIPALRQLQKMVYELVFLGDILDARKNKGKTPDQLAGEIVGYLDQMADATGIPNDRITFLLGNHDGPTIKVHREGMTLPDRVIEPQVGEQIATVLRRAGYTVGTTSPEQTVGLGNTAFSHIPNQTGKSFRAMHEYPRTDLPSGKNEPTVTTAPRLLGPEYQTQGYADAHAAGQIVGPWRFNQAKPFFSLGLPPAGGFQSTSPGNFTGVILLTPPFENGVRIPLGLEFIPGTNGSTGTLRLIGIPTRVTPVIPPDLNENALGIVPRRPLPPLQQRLTEAGVR